MQERPNAPSVRPFVVKRLFLPLFFLMLGQIAVAAPEFTQTRGWAHLNGYSHHFDAPDANNALFGAGFSWYVKRYGRTVQAWEGDVFLDSGRKVSGYFGRSLILPLGRFGGAGVTGALMYHRNFAKYNRANLMPVALPFFETGGEAMKLRIYYVPPVRSASDHQVAFQIMLPVWR